MKSKITFKETYLAGAMASGLSFLVNIFLFFILNSDNNSAEINAIEYLKSLPIICVSIGSIVPCLIGAIVFYILEKLTNSAINIFSLGAIFYVQLHFVFSFFKEKEIQEQNIFIALLQLVDILLLLHFIYSKTNSCSYSPSNIKKSE